MMENNSFIYIPDISGFTKFVTETEVSHSEHIISELLGVILDSNELNFNVSEVEGDAVLFYKLDSPPSISEIYHQSKKMFLNFHYHLKHIEKNTICQCGACKTASHLTLKFIGHLGNFKELTIQSFTKLIGRDVILAHRLLKNNVPSKEYLLFTDNYLNSQNEAQLKIEDEISFEKNIENLENFGEVSTKFINFSPLLQFVPIVSGFDLQTDNNLKSDSSISIQAPLLLVHEKLIDIDSKLEWVPNIKGVKKNSKINRINSTHICSFDNREISFITTKSKSSNDEIYFTERAAINSNILIDNYYKLVDLNGTTKLFLSLREVKLNVDNKGWLYNIIKFIKLKIILLITRKNSKKTLVAFKNYCEKIVQQRRIEN